MENIINEIYEIGEKNKAILKGHIIVSKDTNCIIFAHYCDSTLFYKKFFKVTRDILRVNKLVRKNFKEIRALLKERGYEKIWCRGVFSIYGDLRPIAEKAGLGTWSKNGIIENPKYGTNMIFSAVYFK